MKIQYLTVIFMLIILPIMVVFYEYVDTQINLINTEALYDDRLLNSTYDALKAFQINTINTTYYTPESRKKNIEGAINTFFNSLTTSFKYDGNESSVMKEYVPAVVFTMYDGYYIYSPFENTLTGKNLDEIDQEYLDGDNDGKVLNGLKPYVSYSCRYLYNSKEVVITYSLDNYIIVDIFDGNKHEIKDGYLLDVTKNDEDYSYGGITFKPTDREKLMATLPSEGEDTLEGKSYYYTIRDGTKYYYNGNATNGNVAEIGDDDYIFYVANDGRRIKQVTRYKNNETRFLNYYNEIMQNNTGYQYYKEAYEFTNWFLEEKGLKNLKVSNIINNVNYDGYEFNNLDNQFIFNKTNIEESDSAFNRHRVDVIRAILTTNLIPAISGFSKYSKNNEEFIMPKISEVDWELLENNICIATFFQGMRIGGRAYNNYAVVPNNYTKEFVDENDIYLLKNDNTFVLPNDATLTASNIKTGLSFGPGISRINLERVMTPEGKYYNPLGYADASVSYGFSPYLESYTYMSGASKLNSISTIDMYKYIKNASISTNIKKVFFIALGRERKGAFKYTINNIET